MARLLGGVVLGYVAMAAVVFIGLTGAYLVLGAEGAFQPGVYTVSGVWIALSLVVGLAAAILGGLVARKVAAGVAGPHALAGLVIVLGVALAVSAVLAAPVGEVIRAGSVGPTEAMRQAQTPFWVMLMNPLLGAFGVLLGGGVIRGMDGPEPSNVIAPG